MGLVGVSGTATGIRIDPHLPTETFHVVWPRLTVRSETNAISGTVKASADELIELGVTVPAELRQGELIVAVASEAVPYRREATAVWFALPVERDASVSWSITRAP